MAIISSTNTFGTSSVEGGYNSNNNSNPNSNNNSNSRSYSYQSHQNNRRHQDSYSDNDESESSESSYDSVDSIYSNSSESSTSSAGSSDSSRQKRLTRSQQGHSYVHAYKKPSMPLRNLYIAMDCEMVATRAGRICARVVLVDWKGRTVLDTHVKPDDVVTDFLTFVSGITAAHLEDAPDFATVQAQVAGFLEGNILVGHGLENDLASLKMSHPWWMIRDTAYYQPFMQVRQSGGESFYAPRKLKDLCEARLKKEIQIFGMSHCPYEDAKAALDLYKSHRPRWESCVTSQIHHQRRLARQQMKQAYHAAAAAAMAPVASIAY